MAPLTHEIVEEVLAACRAGAAEIAEAFSRTLGPAVELQVADATKFEPTGHSDLAGPGLVTVLHVGSTAAVLLLSESSGLLPAWYANPDPTGQSKLTTLAQELGMLLLPEAYMPSDFKAGHVSDLRGALKRAGVATGAPVVPLTLTSAGKVATALLVWPAATPGVVFEETAAAPTKPAQATGTPTAASAASAKKPAQTKIAAATLSDLPGFTRSLLKIKVPVMVTLAAKKQPLGQIIELGPGAIIQFDKSCDEMLDMEAAGHRVAQGEAVKVGDKFGLRITSVVLPDERFKSVTPMRS